MTVTAAQLTNGLEQAREIIEEYEKHIQAINIHSGYKVEASYRLDGNTLHITTETTMPLTDLAHGKENKINYQE